MAVRSDVNAAGSLWRLPGLRLVALYTLFGFTGFFATMSALPAELARTGASGTVAGLVTTVFLAATIATQSLVPRLVARVGMTTTLTAGAVALGAPSLLLLVDGGYAWVTMICVVRGAGFGIVTVLGALLAARSAPPARHGEAMGIYGLAIAVPNVLALAGGVALVTAGRFPVVAVLGAAPLLALPLVRRLGQIADGTASTEHSDGAAELSDRPDRAARLAALPPSVVLLAVTLAAGGYLTYLPIARPEGVLATAALLVWGVFGAFSRWGAGVLADRVGMRLLLPAGSVLTIAGIGAVAGGLLGGFDWVILLGSAILGVGFGATQNLTLVAAFRRARQRGQAGVSAVWNIAFDAGTAAGSGAVGLASAAVAIPGALALTAVLVAASLPLAAVSTRPPRDA